MVVVTLVAVIAVAVVMLKMLVWVAATINMVLVVVVKVLVIDVLVNAEFIVAVRVFILKFDLTVSYSVRDSFIDTLAGALLRCLPGIGIEVFAGVNTNAVEVVTALVFPA